MATRLYPNPDAYLPGIAAVERDVPQKYVKALTTGPNPAFLKTKPAGYHSVAEGEVRTDTADIEQELEFITDHDTTAENQQPVTPDTEGKS